MSDILDQIDALTTHDGTQPTEFTPGAVECQNTLPAQVTRLEPVIPSASDIYDASEYKGQVPVERSQVESMLSVRHTPWHSLGNVIPEALRATDVATILETAGMNWTVSKRPLQVARTLTVERTEVQDGDDVLTKTWSDFDLVTPDFFGITRDDTNKVLGVVKKSYQTFQNADALDFLNDLLENDEVTVETAGVLAEGARVWILANIPRDMTVQGDVHVPYLLISTTHDGSGSVRADLTLMRVECANSERWAIRNTHLLDALQKAGIEDFRPSWTHRHSTNVKAKASEARKMLGFASSFLDAYESEIEEMMAKVITPKEFDRMVGQFDFTTGRFSSKTSDADLTDRQKANLAEKQAKVRAFYESPLDGGKFQGTGWGAFQAFSSYDLWGADLRGGEKTRSTRQAVRLLDGTIEARSTSVAERIRSIR